MHPIQWFYRQILRAGIRILRVLREISKNYCRRVLSQRTSNNGFIGVIWNA